MPMPNMPMRAPVLASPVALAALAMLSSTAAAAAAKQPHVLFMLA